MARFLRSKKESIGLSPDDIRFVGVKKIDVVRLRLIRYNSKELLEKEFKSVPELRDPIQPGSVSWINVDGLHDTELLKQLGDEIGVDNLIFGEVLNTDNRPKFSDHGEYLFLSTKMLQFDEENDRVSAENLSLIISEFGLLSFQEQVGDVFNPVRERIRSNRKRIRNAGADFLAFALLDIVIDNYIYIITRIGDKIEDLDDELIENPSSRSLEKINRFKVEINYLRKIIKPCREMILNFSKSDSELIDDAVDVHLKELQNNIELANESVDNYRDILSDQLNIFHTNVTHKLNDILKVLTIFSVIFIPITFIAGIYGTNFDHIPELHFRYGYFAMWGVMVLVALVMIFFFKRKKWF